MSRKTAAQYLAELRDVARARGGVLLSRGYLGDATKLRWRCAEGHVFRQTPGGVKQRKWCRLCGWARAAERRRAGTADRLRRTVARHGGAILSGRYLNSRTPLRFRCANGHEWVVVPDSILQGNWCRRCSNEARHAGQKERVLRRLQKIARKHGGVATGTVFARGRTRIVFRCARGHVWHSLPATVDRGGWCQVCLRDSYLERLRKVAEERGGQVLSRIYVDEDTRLQFRCADGHRFEQRAADTVRGSWCPRCGALRRAEKRRSPAMARFLGIVTERRGTVLTPVYVNSQTPMRFRCAEGHEWQTVPSSIVRGSWCRACGIAERARHPERRVGIPAKQLAEVRNRLERIVKRRDGDILPPGFVGFKAPMTLRCKHGHRWTAPPASIQKGTWCPRCKEASLMSANRELAERRGGECLSRTARSGQELLEWRCALGHRFRRTGEVIKRGVWCPICRQVARGEIERMKQIALERGGECLSDRYVDAATRLRWRCRDGHVWSAVPGMIVRGHWCRRCGWQSSHSRARLSIEDMRQTAAERSGRCLSESYHGSKVPLRWRCARGHTWMAHPNRVRQGSWCPACAHSVRGTLAGMRALAFERGGRCLSRAWNNHMEPLRFECARGHRFHAIGAAIRTGLWCPHCRPPSDTSARVR